MQIDKKKLRKQRCNAEKTKISNVYLRTDPLFSGIIIETMLDLKGYQVVVVCLAGVANTIPKGPELKTTGIFDSHSGHLR